MTGNAADNRSVCRFGVIHDDIAESHAPQRANWRRCGPTHATAKPEKERRVRYVAHRDVVDRHIFEQAAVNCLQRQAATVIKHAIRDRDVLKASVGFGAELYAPSRAERSILISEIALESSVRERPFIVTADLTIGDRHILRRPRIAQRE